MPPPKARRKVATMSEDELYDKWSGEAENRLRPLLTDGFLATLAEAVRTCGWSVDHVESVKFAEWCFSVADKEAPNLNPFDYSHGPA